MLISRANPEAMPMIAVAGSVRLNDPAKKASDEVIEVESHSKTLGPAWTISAPTNPKADRFGRIVWSTNSRNSRPEFKGDGLQAK